MFLICASLLLMFLIYLNVPNLYQWVDVKLFADDTSLFSVVENSDESASKLSNVLIGLGVQMERGLGVQMENAFSSWQSKISTVNYILPKN